MSRPFPSRRLLSIALLLLLFAALKLAVLWWWQQQQSRPDTTAPAAVCDIRTACPLAGGARIRFGPQTRVHDPFDIRIDGLPEQTRSVHVQFAMNGMDMGFNRFDLQRAGDGSWQARHIRLPLCLESRHDYLADIHIDGRTERIPFSAP